MPVASLQAGGEVDTSPTDALLPRCVLIQKSILYNQVQFMQKSKPYDACIQPLKALGNLCTTQHIATYDLQTSILTQSNALSLLLLPLPPLLIYCSATTASYSSSTYQPPSAIAELHHSLCAYRQTALIHCYPTLVHLRGGCLCMPPSSSGGCARIGDQP